MAPTKLRAALKRTGLSGADARRLVTDLERRLQEGTKALWEQRVERWRATEAALGITDEHRRDKEGAREWRREHGGYRDLEGPGPGARYGEAGEKCRGITGRVTSKACMECGLFHPPGARQCRMCSTGLPEAATRWKPRATQRRRS